MELSASAAAVSAAIGISLSALEAPIVVAVVAIFSLIAGVIGTIQSLFMIAQSAGGIYSTATGTGTVYDKAEAFAHDFTIMVVGIIILTGSVKSIEASLSSFKSAARELFGRKSRLTPSEVTKTYKGAKLITSFDDFTEYAKGFLDEDALQYAKEVLGNDKDDTAKLKKVAQLIEDGSGKIGKKLSKEELKAGLDALWDDAGVEGALALIEHVNKGTFGRNEVTQLLEKYSEMTGTTREKLLSLVQDSKLARLVNELYRPTAVVGDGGTADMLVYELYTNSDKHLIKAKGRITEIKRLIASGKLGLNDLDIAEALLNDLEYAVSLFD